MQIVANGTISLNKASAAGTWYGKNTDGSLFGARSLDGLRKRAKWERKQGRTPLPHAWHQIGKEQDHNEEEHLDVL